MKPQTLIIAIGSITVLLITFFMLQRHPSREDLTALSTVNVSNASQPQATSAAAKPIEDVDSAANPLEDENTLLAAGDESTPIAGLDLAFAQRLARILTDPDLTTYSEEQAVAALREAGLEPQRTVEGDPATGQRVQIRADALDKGIHSFLLAWEIIGDNRLQFARMQYGLNPRDGVFDTVIEQLEEALPGTPINTRTETGFQAWEFEDSRILWIKSYTGEDSRPDLLYPETIFVTLEYIMD